MLQSDHIERCADAVSRKGRFPVLYPYAAIPSVDTLALIQKIQEHSFEHHSRNHRETFQMASHDAAFARIPGDEVMSAVIAEHVGDGIISLERVAHSVRGQYRRIEVWS